jgi:hypothetical protein
MKNWIIDKMCFLAAMLTLSCIGVAVITCLTLEKGVKPTPTQNLLLFICLGVMISQIVIGLCSRWLPKWYACDGMGWHMRPDIIGFDGCSNNGQCPKCGKDVMQDSQGNWY